MSTPALPCTTNFHAYGAPFAATLASMSHLTDEGHAACPKEWRDLTALLHTLIEDEGLTTAMTAWEAALPESTVLDYRRLVGI
jgi:hypothetical protein